MNTEFIEAAKRGDVDKIKILLLYNPEVNPADDNDYVIRWASDRGHLELVKLLLNDTRVDPADVNNIAIRAASRRGHLEVVKLLLNDKRIDPADNDNYAIRLASYLGHMEIVRLLLDDPRVDWRSAVLNVKVQLINNEENILKSELTTSYLSIERFSPQTTLGCELGRKKSQIPKEIIRQIVYLGQYQGIYQPTNSEIPLVISSTGENIKY